MLDDKCGMYSKECIARSRELRNFVGRAGPFTVPVIKSCYPTKHHCLTGCVMKPNIVYAFPDSAFQKRIDLGKCVGSCNGELCIYMHNSLYIASYSHRMYA